MTLAQIRGELPVAYCQTLLGLASRLAPPAAPKRAAKDISPKSVLGRSAPALVDQRPGRIAWPGGGGNQGEAAAKAVY
jgi:hypothetical protein